MKNVNQRKGRNYPCIPDHNKPKTGDHIEFHHENGYNRDDWQFYKSGKFEQDKSFNDYLRNKTYTEPPNEENDSSITNIKSFKLIEKIWIMTEIFLFASRLAKEIDSGLTIEIKLNNMKDRHLEICSWDRLELVDDHICSTNTISLTPIPISKNISQIQHKHFAKKLILEILDSFGPIERDITPIIDAEQIKFYENQI